MRSTWEGWEGQAGGFFGISKTDDPGIVHQDSGVLLVRPVARQHPRLAEVVESVLKSARISLRRDG